MRLLLFLAALLLAAGAFEPVEELQLLIPAPTLSFERLVSLNVSSFDRAPSQGMWRVYATPWQRAHLRERGVGFIDIPHASSIMARRTRDVHGPANPMGEYHTQEELKEVLSRLDLTHPDVARMSVIGHSVMGRELAGIELTDYATLPSDPGRPAVMLTGNIHGDETVGREMLIRFADRLVAQWADGVPGAVQLLNTTRIFVLPSMNPDGFALGRRSNAAGVDLNRNFPDQFMGQRGVPQAETVAVRGWMRQHNYVLSATLHGGAVCANYPWDGNRERHSGRYTACPDDAMFRELASTYSKAHTKMHLSNHFPGGITNGAHWYVLYGGKQDYVYLHTNGMEITLELSHLKYPPDSYLDLYWGENREALTEFVRMAHSGVKGRVTDAEGLPVANTIVDVDEIGHPVRTDANGWYWRLLPRGRWTLSAMGIQKTVQVTNKGPTAQRVDFQTGLSRLPRESA